MRAFYLREGEILHISNLRSLGPREQEIVIYLAREMASDTGATGSSPNILKFDPDRPLKRPA